MIWYRFVTVSPVTRTQNTGLTPANPLNRSSEGVTHRFHRRDEVHGLLIDVFLQETESLVVQDEADG